jgi:hypothetical protein
LTPQIAAGLLGFVIFIQGLFVLFTTVILQWADCGLRPVFEEFSFGLSKIRVDIIGPVSAIDINLRSVVDAGKVVSAQIGQFAMQSDAVFGLLIAGLLVGIVALIVGILGALPKPPGRLPVVTWFKIAAGLLGLDGLLVLIAVLIYSIGVMPNLGELGIPDFVKEFAKDFAGSLTTSVLGGVLACSSPYMCSGLIMTILEVILIFAASAVIGLGVGPPKYYDEARDMRAEMMQFPGGKGRGGKGGYGAPPPGYGGPPPGGYGGPPPGGPPRGHPFEGGPGSSRMGPGYGAPPPPPGGYAYNYGGKGY